MILFDSFIYDSVNLWNYFLFSWKYIKQWGLIRNNIYILNSFWLGFGSVSDVGSSSYVLQNSWLIVFCSLVNATESFYPFTFFSFFDTFISFILFELWRLLCFKLRLSSPCRANTRWSWTAPCTRCAATPASTVSAPLTTCWWPAAPTAARTATPSRWCWRWRAPAKRCATPTVWKNTKMYEQLIYRY